MSDRHGKATAVLVAGRVAVALAVGVTAILNTACDPPELAKTDPAVHADPAATDGGPRVRTDLPELVLSGRMPLSVRVPPGSPPRTRGRGSTSSPGSRSSPSTGPSIRSGAATRSSRTTRTSSGSRRRGRSRFGGRTRRPTSCSGRGTRRPRPGTHTTSQFPLPEARAARSCSSWPTRAGRCWTGRTRRSPSR